MASKDHHAKEDCSFETKTLRKAYLSLLPVGEHKFKHIRDVASAVHLPPNPETLGKTELRDTSCIDWTQVECPTLRPLRDFQTAAYFIADQIPDCNERAKFHEEIFLSGNYRFVFDKGHRIYENNCSEDDLSEIHTVLVKLLTALGKLAEQYEKSGNSKMEAKFNRYFVLGNQLCQLSEEFTNNKGIFEYNEAKTTIGMRPLPSTQSHMAAMYEELGIPKNFGEIDRHEMRRIFEHKFDHEVEERKVFEVKRFLNAVSNML